jgi:hypothetical protein
VVACSGSWFGSVLMARRFVTLSYLPHTTHITTHPAVRPNITRRRS